MRSATGLPRRWSRAWSNHSSNRPMAACRRAVGAVAGWGRGGAAAASSASSATWLGAHAGTKGSCTGPWA